MLQMQVTYILFFVCLFFFCSGERSLPEEDLNTMYRCNARTGTPMAPPFKLRLQTRTPRLCDQTLDELHMRPSV